MNFSLTQEQYDFIADRVVKPVEARGGHVFCYGSRARGDYQRYSDLDLMIEAEADPSSLVGEPQEELSQSDFPYKVDLVEFRHFAGAYKAGYLRDKRPYTPLPRE